MQNKRLKIIVLVTAILLLIPLLAMQFTTEVNWTVADFMIAGVLLLGTGLIIDLILRKIKNINFRTGAVVAMVIIFLLVWAELAVGIFGSPLAGS